MCMPRIFGNKLVDGKIEEKKFKKTKSEKKPKKQINQASVEFEDEINYKCD
jgi:hypothetical protein